MNTPQSDILLISCTDRKGLVHTITGTLFRHGVNIISNGEFVDPDTGRFFMRTEFSGEVDPGSLQAELARSLPPEAQIRLTRRSRKRIVIFASREPHCLGDLLLRHSYGELNAEILAVLSNHPDLEPLTARFERPFHFVPSANRDRRDHEQELLKRTQPYQPEYIVLAKYMRILSATFVDAFPHRMINIHHSFLPAFVGANPYRQAYQRGVKIIGATAHFVTEQLDQGPIIAQSIIPVDHSHSAADMARAGREIEKQVLAHALRLAFEERVFVSGNRTIIFD